MAMILGIHDIDEDDYDYSCSPLSPMSRDEIIGDPDDVHRGGLLAPMSDDEITDDPN